MRWIYADVTVESDVGDPIRPLWEEAVGVLLTWYAIMNINYWSAVRSREIWTWRDSTSLRPLTLSVSVLLTFFMSAVQIKLSNKPQSWPLVLYVTAVFTKIKNHRDAFLCSHAHMIPDYWPISLGETTSINPITGSQLLRWQQGWT